MMIQSTTWPPTPEELAWLNLNYTNREIAAMYDVSHSMVQRKMDEFGIKRISYGNRSRLQNKSNFPHWAWDPTNPVVPTWMQDDGRPLVKTEYNGKQLPQTTFRAIAQYRLGRMIPRFFDVHHTCGNIMCLNPDHGVIVIEKGHSRCHNGGGNCSMFDLSRYDSTSYGPECIEGNIPDIATLNIPDVDWEQFMVKSMLL